MTYLSRIRINPLRAQSRAMLASPRVMHAYVCAGIPGTPDSERILWRLDVDNPHRPLLFVLTQSKPDWTHIVEAAGWPDADDEHFAIGDYTPLLARIAPGREFAFRLTASPVQNTNRPDKPTPTQAARIAAGDRRSFRLAHRTATAQLGWLLDRTTRHGFDIPPAHTDPAVPGPADDKALPAPDVRLIARNRHEFSKGDRGRRITLHTATFEGRLRVTDTALLTDALLGGIGPSKAYGCGLLTLALLPGGQ
ncbi:type I-E CRISPR-associated protein Cas6/Cse3/CasE [Microbispora sp. SCL1-1]|uniref:type I-E CRISPR-associated protein Cas6/Cse3/CasE n=1 Tax=Microbispora TaxID=2005 RepID=UPI001157584C|nr:MULTISPECIES: type I-E CRISPR-associated protein Cas6/Cse3/CasE [unclassified Microbispora]NJP29364.1 type I-E CRISPR-associated protein Cas6/Cse3/CasE [Microbispora sp. CL1-1]TQS05443.1 type I-E CRISPR-associated protein Cas6/Cse3/CasE [Microbispora sp. SCL1-1]